MAEAFRNDLNSSEGTKVLKEPININYKCSTIKQRIHIFNYTVQIGKSWIATTRTIYSILGRNPISNSS